MASMASAGARETLALGGTAAASQPVSHHHPFYHLAASARDARSPEIDGLASPQRRQVGGQRPLTAASTLRPMGKGPKAICSAPPHLPAQSTAPWQRHLACKPATTRKPAWMDLTLTLLLPVGGRHLSEPIPPRGTPGRSRPQTPGLSGPGSRGHSVAPGLAVSRTPNPHVRPVGFLTPWLRAALGPEGGGGQGQPQGWGPRV